MYRSWRINTAKCYADVFSEPTTTTPAVLQDWWSYMIHSILPPLWLFFPIPWSKSHALQNAIYIVGGRSIQPQLAYFKNHRHWQHMKRHVCFSPCCLDQRWKKKTWKYYEMPGSSSRPWDANFRRRTALSEIHSVGKCRTSVTLGWNLLPSRELTYLLCR